MCAFTIYISIARKYVNFPMRQFKIFNRYLACIIILLRMSILQLYDRGRSILRQSAAENDLYENQFTNMSCQKMLLFIVDYETKRLLSKAILNNINILLQFETCWEKWYGFTNMYIYCKKAIIRYEKGWYFVYVHSQNNCFGLGPTKICQNWR